MNLEMAAFDVAGTTVKDDGIVIQNCGLQKVQSGLNTPSTQWANPR
jgi:hypothetical protein